MRNRTILATPSTNRGLSLYCRSFVGTWFSIKNSLPQFRHVVLFIRINSIGDETVPCFAQ